MELMGTDVFRVFHESAHFLRVISFMRRRRRRPAQKLGAAWEQHNVFIKYSYWAEI